MSLRYIRDFTDEEEKILLDSISDIKVWMDGAADGRISHSTGQLVKRRKEELIKEGALTIPAKDIDLARNAFADVKYKNRSQRDLENDLKGQGGSE